MARKDVKISERRRHVYSFSCRLEFQRLCAFWRHWVLLLESWAIVARLLSGIMMNIPHDYSSDDDSSSSSSSTASNEVVDEVLGQNFQLQEIERYQFQPRFQSNNDESGDSSEEQNNAPLLAGRLGIFRLVRCPTYWIYKWRNIETFLSEKFCYVWFLASICLSIVGANVVIAK